MEFDQGVWLSNSSVSPGLVQKFTLELSKRQCLASNEPLDKSSAEFPSVHPYRHGMPNSRFSYIMASDRKGYNMPYRDIVKV